MAEELTLIRDLALVAVTAAVVALLFHRLRLPVVLGYLAAGVLVGPNVLPVELVRDPENIALLAELGVLFLLFSLGLDFHLGKLRRVGGVALAAGTLEVSLMVGVGYLVGTALGWQTADALVAGALLAISSTTLIVKVLGEQGRLSDPASEAIFGILLVEDLVAVLLIALLSSIALTGTVTFLTVGMLLVRVAIFVIATLVIGLVVVPRLVDHVAGLRVEELLVLLAVAIAFATSMVALALGLSLALGAFIAGAIVAESRASTVVERRIAPLRDVFTAVFFVSTGILIDPLAIIAYWPAILLLSVATILGNILSVGFATFVAGFPPAQALRVGIGMAMIGEFSFVIAGLGANLGVTSGFLLPIAVSVSAVTAFVTPPLIRHSDRIIAGLGRIAPPWLASYASMYSAWVKRARRGREGGEAFTAAYDIGAIRRLVTFAALLVALGVGANYVSWYIADIFGPQLGGERLVALSIQVAFGVLAIPVAVGLFRALRDIVDSIVGLVVPARESKTGRGAAAAAVLRNTLSSFLAIPVGLIAVAAGAVFLPPLPLLAGAAIVVLLSAVLLRGSLQRLNRQIEQAVDVVFQSQGGATPQRAEVLSLIRERYPWDLHLQNVAIPASSRAANRRIRELQLPQRTGATIVTHEREGAQTVNPPPDLLLLSGDVVGVLGERQQVTDARRLLTSEMPSAQRPLASPEEGVQVEEFDIAAGSPLAGLTLAGSRIRETTGASIVGLRREGVPILNPAPVLRLQPGDTVVVLGSPTQVAAARAMFEPAAPDG